MVNHQIANPDQESTPIQVLSPLHEMAARFIAAGVPASQVCITCNRKPNWVYALNRSPTFKARVAAIQEELFSGSNLPQQLEQLASRCASEVSERLLKAPQDFSVRDLVSVIGQGTKQGGTSVTVSVNTAVALVDEKNKVFIED